VDDAREYLLRVGAAPRAIAAGDLAVDHGGSERLLCAPIGRVDARIKQETKDGRQFDREMRGKALHRRQRTGCHNAIGQLVEEVAARDGDAVRGDVAGVPAIADGEAALKDRVHVDR